MSEAKNSYEFFLVLSTKLGEEGTEKIVKKFQDLIESSGTLENIDKWGKRKLAYLINKESEGYYVLFKFASVASFPAELDRVCKITDGVLRSIIVRQYA